MEPPTYVPSLHYGNVGHPALTYNCLGQTDLVVSCLGIGGSSAGGSYGAVTEEETVEMITEGVRGGVNYVDTAPWYRDSQRIIGKALRLLPRKSFYIATKVGRYPASRKDMIDFSAQRTVKTVDESLSLLGVDCVDVIQIHDVEYGDVELILNETLPALQTVVDQGKARYIGITGYDLNVLDELIERSKVKISTVLSYARSTLNNQDLRNFIPKWKALGLGIINASMTGMGLFIPEGPPDWHPATRDIKEVAREAAQLCEKEGVSIARLAVKCSFTTPGVDVHIMGSKDVHIQRINIETAFSALTQHEERVTRDVVEMFEKLDQTHWTGVEVEKWRKKCAQSTD